MLTRRSAIKQVTAALAAPSLIGCADARKSAVALLHARKQAAHRKRPLILDDDGDMAYADETLRGPEAFLSLRMNDCRDAGVNSVSWCMMWAIAIKGKSPTRYWQTQMRGASLTPAMPDPTPVIAVFCRRNDIEIVGSLRMNDCHDAFGMPFPKLAYPLKVEHPELLIGEESQRGGPDDGLAAAMWSGLDYAHEKVRADRLWWIENSAKNYDLDGLDLNFFRMPWLFKLGEEEKNIPLMTGFLRQARKRLDEISRLRGRPLLLGVRIPGTLEACLRMGIDIETWLREGLIDRLLTGGGYVCYSTPAEELVALGHRYEVPFYPCINCPGSSQLGNGNLRAAASNLWWAGGDGIYLWNFQYLPGGSIGYGRLAAAQYKKHLPDIADPARLRYLDKSFAVNHRVREQYQRASAPAPLPLTLGRQADEGSGLIPVRIGDDITAAHRNGKLRDVALKLKPDGVVAGDLLTVSLNGSAASAEVTTGSDWLSLALPPTAVKQGVNHLQLAIARRGDAARKEIVIEQARVDVRYRRA